MPAINITKILADIVEIIATHWEVVLSNNLDANLSTLQPYNHEEADTHLLVHALDTSKSVFKRLMIVTVYIDVVVLALCHFLNLDFQGLWIEIGTGRIADGFPFIYMRKPCTGRCAKHLPFLSFKFLSSTPRLRN